MFDQMAYNYGQFAIDIAPSTQSRLATRERNKAGT